MDLDFDFNLQRGHVGFVAIVGRPNVGKSTLINQLMDYHLTAVSPKPQTTRRHWQAVYCDDDSQIVFLDTPGIHDAGNLLGESMLKSINRQLENADYVLCMVTPSSHHGAEEELLIEAVNRSKKEVILVINKCDEHSKEEIDEVLAYFKNKLKGEIVSQFQISALENSGVEEMLKDLKSRLPVDYFFYDEDHFTDATEREIAQELIQEAVFVSFEKEIPHAMTVVIDSWKEDEKKVKIHATIFTDHERLKKIIIGRNGQKINEVKKLAIQKLRENIELRIELKLFVKVNPDWRNNSNFLDDQGFNV